MDRKPYGQLIPTRDGRYLQMYIDGSMTVYDQYFNVVSDDAEPNPKRAALIAAGQEHAAAQDALYTRASNEDARRFDLNYGLNRQGNALRAKEINNQYQLGLRNAKTNEQRLALDRWYQQQQVELSKARLGYDTLNMAAQLRGPADYVQASNFARGVANQPGTIGFLSALRNNVNLPGFGAQQGVPQAESIDTLTQKLTGSFQAGTGGAANASGGSVNTGGGGAGTTAVSGGGVAPQTQADALQSGASALYAQGAHKLGGGALEQLTPTELSLLQSGVEGAGGDWSMFLDQYKRSRVGQGTGLMRAA